MEPISFGLAIVAEARTLAFSIKNRIVNYRDGPATFRTLIANVDGLAEQISQVEMILGKFPALVPNDISDIFNKTFSRVRTILAESNAAMEKSFSKPFAAGSSSVMGRVRSKAIRTFRANSLRSKMDDVEAKINDASSQLLQLTLALSSALKMQEHHEALLPKFENLGVIETTQDSFLPRTNVSALTNAVNLDFDAQDSGGKPATPEALLKQSVLLSEASSTVTAAAGVMQPVYGIVGMAGVGKTVALQGLAHDKDIRLRFPDGVLFMTLGQGATVQTVLGALKKILAITGGNKVTGVVASCTALQDAVDYAAPWFEKRICLFLVDDVWPTENSRTGFLTDLRQLLRDSPESRMAVSTRSRAVAQCAGAIVKFGARDPLGSVSMKIFMAHATSGTTGEVSAKIDSPPSSSVLKILSICSGLPIALAVTGSAVAFLSDAHGDLESACESYATRLEKKRSLLGDEDTLEGRSLNASILLSLECLEVEFSQWKKRHCHVIDYSISDIYTSLCVLQNQTWASASVLGRLWRLDTDAAMDVMDLLCGMSLATLHFRQTSQRSSKEAGIVLHDLQLEFCQRQATEAKKTSMWHCQLLTGYLETANHPTAEELGSRLITSFKPRPWWSEAVPEDGYIHSNLSRHLSCAGQGIELAALLLDGRWTELRGKIGGILALKSDFEILETILMRLGSSSGQETNSGDVRRGFDQIFKAIQLSWARMSQGLRFLHFQVCGRLVKLKNSSTIVNRFVESFEKCTPKPCLIPMSSFLPALDSALIMEVPVDEISLCVACSPCGRFIAAGAGSDIMVAKSSTGEKLQHLRGHTGLVRCIAFARGSKQIVSGSEDHSVIVWAWESSESPVHILKGHCGVVTGVAMNGDGEQIISSADDKALRVWDSITGAQICALSGCSSVHCVAVCEGSRRIALGLNGGTLKVLDSVTRDVLFEDAEAHEDDIFCASFSPDGTLLATGSEDSTVRVWDTQTWTRAGACLEGHEHFVSSVAFRADGMQIASSSGDGTIRLWDVGSGKCIAISPVFDSSMEGVAFMGDGERIVSGSQDGIVRIWDARFRTASNEQVFEHSAFVNGVAISQSGLQVASASTDRTVRLWDTRTGEQIGVPMEGHTDEVNCVTFSPDGCQVVSGSSDNTLRLWDAETQTQIGDPIEGHKNTVHSVSFSADELRIITGSQDKTLRIWNADTHKQIGEALQGHTSAVVCVSESADGCHIVSRDSDARTFVWNREERSIVWKSKKLGNRFQNSEADYESNSEKGKAKNTISVENKVTDDEAEKIISSCGQKTPHLWPQTFPAYTADLYCEKDFVYSNFLGEKILLGALDLWHWTYHSEKKLFAAGLLSGAVAICTLSTE